MGTVAANVLIGRARRLLRDRSNVSTQFDDLDLLDTLVEGQQELMAFKPDANTVVAPLVLVAGARQTLPADCLHLIRVLRNLSVDAPISVPLPVSFDALNAVDPGWMTAADEAGIEHYVYEEEDNQHFWVYPPAPAESVEIMYSAMPAAPATTGDVIGVPDIYAPALTNYMCYRALAEDMQNPANRELAQAFYQMFVVSLSTREEAEKKLTPTRKINNG